MNASRMTVVAVVACLTSSMPGEAFAWGPDGHRIVCRIAYQLLDSARRNEIQRLTGRYRTPDNGRFTSFADGCLFPDEARSKARDNVPGWDKYDRFEIWHFLNVPRTTHRIEDEHCAGNCVLTGIAHHAERLRTAPADEARAEALFFLGHWVGDIHQPLHVSFTDDRGGNQIQPIHGGFYSSGHLHAVWDSGIIGKAAGAGGWRIYADRLAREITPAERVTWVGGPPISWAQESYNLTTKPKTQYCAWRNVTNTLTCGGLSGARTLRQPYQDEFQDDVEMRLQQAGARLADLLRRNLVEP